LTELEGVDRRLEDQQRLTSDIVRFAAYYITDDGARLRFLREWLRLSDDMECKFKTFQVDEIALANGAT
jgi:hypothetical protein